MPNENITEAGEIQKIKDHLKNNWGKYALGAGALAGAAGLGHFVGGAPASALIQPTKMAGADNMAQQPPSTSVQKMAGADSLPQQKNTQNMSHNVASKIAPQPKILPSTSKTNETPTMKIVGNQLIDKKTNQPVSDAMTGKQIDATGGRLVQPKPISGAAHTQFNNEQELAKSTALYNKWKEAQNAADLQTNKVELMHAANATKQPQNQQIQNDENRKYGPFGKTGIIPGMGPNSGNIDYNTN